MKRFASALLTVGCLSLASTALATDLVTVGDYLWDIQDGLGGAFRRDGSVEDGGNGAATRFDSYDNGFVLRVNGTAYNPTGAGTVSGRSITLPVTPIAGLNVSRLIYVPASGGNWIRYVELIENPSAAPIMATVAVSTNLGSDGSETVTGTSSGDTTITTADAWFGTDDSPTGGDYALTFVIQANEPTVRAAAASRTSGNVDYSYTASVPAGGRIAVMHFGLQSNTAAEGVAEAVAILAEPESIYTGLEAVRDAIINWGTRTTPCMGADGTACTVSGTGPGRCYGGVCCAGCWDAAAMRCRTGRTGSECGAAGALCASCSDDDLCTSDVCTAGVCSNPNAPSGTACDDGAFCTATDRCDGAGSCLGSGTPCDDGVSCTTDSCDELAARCSNVTMMGVCNIAGMCVPAGTPNPTNACQVCDASRSMTGWSPVSTGTRCGTERCSAGRYFPPGACSSAGICEVPAIRDCPTGRCAGSICEGACTAASCPMGTFCSASTLMCEPLIANGGGCSLSATCASGFCVDNVCCEEACDGLCSRCGATGRCALIPTGGDPDRECAGDDVCDGAGMCRPASMPDAGTDAPIEPDAPVEPLDAGVDAPMPMDAGPDDAGAPLDAGGGLPDVPLRADAGAPEPTRRGCSCSASDPRSAPGSLVGLAVALGLALRWRRR
jgi:hypothetical protein